jgi:hypothetical protein
VSQQIRDSRGVALRRDGAGDVWAQQHRQKLGRDAYVRDGDQSHRVSLEIECGENRLFMEMAFDSYKNRGRLIRRCGTVARVDRKATVEAAQRALDNGEPTIAHMLSDCRADREMQDGIGGRAFLVCGNGYPFTYIELDPFTGNELQRKECRKESSWVELYDELGMTEDRRRLEHWLLRGGIGNADAP